MPDYGYALSEEAVHAFALRSFPQRRRLLQLFDALARHPSQSGDYQESGAAGRIYQLRLLDDLLITWWTDHAAKEVRIVRIEFLE